MLEAVGGVAKIEQISKIDRESRNGILVPVILYVLCCLSRFFLSIDRKAFIRIVYLCVRVAKSFFYCVCNLSLSYEFYGKVRLISVLIY